MTRHNSVFFIEGASELTQVIDEIDDHYDENAIDRYSAITQPVLAAHSEKDEQAKFEGVERMIENHPDRRTEFYGIVDLEHSSVVLEEAAPGPDGGTPANPHFEQMIEVMIAFARRHVTAL